LAGVVALLAGLALVAGVASVMVGGGSSPSRAAGHHALSTPPLPTITLPPVTPAVVSLPLQPATVATASVPTVPLYAAPGAGTPSGQLSNPNELGVPLVFLAVATQGDWIQTMLPQRPNGSTAWIPRSDVTLAQDPYSIRISLSARTLVLYNAGTATFSTSVAPGEPTSPTPTGSFYVTEVLKVNPPTTAYGPYALGTSAFSNTYYSFDGGPGQVAIHGTNQPWLIGGYASHGCVRLTNEAITTVAQQVPAGTPVEIDP
jgi:lipoprotein-anchoring transpeptidase ErfK/SrfK